MQVGSLRMQIFQRRHMQYVAVNLHPNVPWWQAEGRRMSGRPSAVAGAQVTPQTQNIQLGKFGVISVNIHIEFCYVFSPIWRSNGVIYNLHLANVAAVILAAA